MQVYNLIYDLQENIIKLTTLETLTLIRSKFDLLFNRIYKKELNKYFNINDFFEYNCKLNYTNIAKYIINKEKCPDIYCLRVACEDSNIEIVKFLISKGVIPDIHCINHACEYGNIEIVKFLIEIKGIIPDNDCLYHACLSRNIDTVKYIVSKGIIPDMDCLKNACEYGNIEIIKFLIEIKGVIPDNDCLYHACLSRNIDTVKYIIIQLKIQGTKIDDINEYIDDFNITTLDNFMKELYK